MRVVVLLLVLANLGFFAWSRWLAPAPAALGPTTGIEGLPRIEVLSPGATPPPRPPPPTAVEEPAAPPAAAADPGVADASGAPGASAACLTIGPFDTAAGADALVRRLAGSVYQVRRRSIDTEIPDGYIVMIRGFPSTTAQERAQRRLSRGGLTDAYPLPRLADGFAVSVGLFSEPDGAERRAAEARRLGFEPEIAARSRPGAIHWVNLSPAGAGPAAAGTTGSADPGWELAARQRIDTLARTDAARLLADKQVIACP
jgi:hypothetical protein